MTRMCRMRMLTQVLTCRYLLYPLRLLLSPFICLAVYMSIIIKNYYALEKLHLHSGGHRLSEGQGRQRQKGHQMHSLQCLFTILRAPVCTLHHVFLHIESAWRSLDHVLSIVGVVFFCLFFFEHGPNMHMHRRKVNLRSASRGIRPQRLKGHYKELLRIEDDMPSDVTSLWAR